MALVAVLAGGVAAQQGKRRGLDSLDLLNSTKAESDTSASNLTSPNELDGYDFFRLGKLNGLRLGMTTKSEIVKLFGSECEQFCDYDSSWSVGFDFFSENEMMIEALGKPGEKQYVTRKEAAGKMEEVLLRPKRRISFENVTFPAAFRKHTYLETGNPGSGRKDGVWMNIYEDDFGLQYWIFDRFTAANLPDPLEVFKEFKNSRKGDLIAIKYTIPAAKQGLFLVEQK